MVLGDSFPASEKEKSFLNQCKFGVILYLPCDFTTPPKEKYLLMAAEDGDILCFVINSEINPFIRRNRSFRQCQVLLKQGEHDFLDYDSYVNCCDLHKFKKDLVEKMVIDDIWRVKGRLSQTATKEVLNAVAGAKTLTPKEKMLVQAHLT